MVETEQSAVKRAEVVVFSIIRDSACRECGAELLKGQFLQMEDGRPLCLRCADLDHLVFLPRGHTALTRRASTHSTLRAVVVRFSPTRKRYERQGVLVDETALARAEQECLADGEARALARQRAAEYRERVDARYAAAFARRLGDLFPGCPIASAKRSPRMRARSTQGALGGQPPPSSLTSRRSSWRSGHTSGMAIRRTMSCWLEGSIARRPVPPYGGRWMTSSSDGGHPRPSRTLPDGTVSRPTS